MSKAAAIREFAKAIARYQHAYGENSYEERDVSPSRARFIDACDAAARSYHGHKWIVMLPGSPPTWMSLDQYLSSLPEEVTDEA